VQASEQRPATQKGAVDGHWLFEVQVVAAGVGWQTPALEQVKPAPQGIVALQAATHWPLSHTWLPVHWLL
jgi:hypothetical protein